MRRSFLRHLVLKAWILFSVSKQGPCFKAIEEVTREFYSLNLLAKLVFHCQVLFNLDIAVTAETILMWTSAEQVPSLHRVAPRYLKLVIISNFWLFILISALMLFVLLVMILLFSLPTSIPYTVALSLSLLVRSWKSSLLLPPIRLI